MLLLGDSHSVSLFPGLDPLLAAHGENLIEAGGGCLPFRGVVSVDKKMPTETHMLCPAIIGSALDFALATPQIHTVILAARGPIYQSGKGFPGREGYVDELYHDRIIPFVDRPDLRDHTAVWAEAMRATITELLAKDKRVIFVLDNPELGFNPQSCVDIRPFRLNPKPLRSPCAVARSEFDERNADYRALVKKILAEFPQVAIVDGAKPFCDERWCWAMKDGEMFYRDDDHLSTRRRAFGCERNSRCVEVIKPGCRRQAWVRRPSRADFCGQTLNRKWITSPS